MHFYLSASLSPKLVCSPSSSPYFSIHSPRRPSACGYPGLFTCPRILDMVFTMVSLALDATGNTQKCYRQIKQYFSHTYFPHENFRGLQVCAIIRLSSILDFLKRSTCVVLITKLHVIPIVGQS